MTSLPSLPRAGLVGALDIEVTTDAEAAAIAGERGSRIKVGLLRVTAACLLEAREEEDGRWRDVRLHSFEQPDEFELLMALDDRLGDFRKADGTLATFNGRYDISVLRRRSAHHWLFGLTVSELDELPHHDLMRRVTRGWSDGPVSLREACAALGIPIHAGVTPSAAPTQIRKCQADVCATLLLLLYEMALERRDPRVLVEGWSALARSDATRAPHLRQFRRHPKLDAALGGAGAARRSFKQMQSDLLAGRRDLNPRPPAGS